LCYVSAGVQAERRPPLATCAGCIAVCWRPDGAAPNTSCGALVAVTTRAATALGRLYDLETSLDPRTALGKGEHARTPCSREYQLSGVGFLREAREKCLSTGHYLSQALDFIEMVSGLP